MSNSRLSIVCFLPLIVFLALPCSLTFGLELELSGQYLVDESDSVIQVEVVEQHGKMREDSNGRHIYTDVVVKPDNVLYGAPISAKTLTVEVIGGTYNGWREDVSFSPTFETGEKCVLFLKPGPWRIVGDRQGRKTIRENKLVIDGYLISPKDFSDIIKKYKAEKPEKRDLKALIRQAGAQPVDETSRKSLELQSTAAGPAVHQGPPNKGLQSSAAGDLLRNEDQHENAARQTYVHWCSVFV